MADTAPGPCVASTMAPSRPDSYKIALLCSADPQRPPPSTSTSAPPPVESRSVLIRNRLDEFRRRSTVKNPICYKCGSQGHIAIECCNSPLCLVCNKHGHRSRDCALEKEPLRIPSPLSDSLEPSGNLTYSAPMATIRNPILLFNSTPASEAQLSEFQQSFILSDIARWGPDRIEDTLNRVFAQATWKVMIFDDQKYLVRAPTLDWQRSTTRSTVLRLDGVKFPIVPWEPRYSEGKKLTSLWVKIKGYPHML